MLNIKFTRKYFFTSIKERLMPKHIAKIDFEGGINRTSYEKFRGKFSRIEKNHKRISAIAFIINSPGGSAVYSNLITSYIKGFCQANQIKLYTFAEDVAASGGYWLLTVGDEVYCQSSSKVGSLGALASTIDIKQLYDKYNLERLYLTSKEEENTPDLNKLFDLFQHKTDKEIKEIRNLLEDVHYNFTQHVLTYRERKLTKDKEMLDRIFNADIFLGYEALNLGLVDEVGDYKMIMKNKYPQLKIKDYNIKHSQIVYEKYCTPKSYDINSHISQMFNTFIRK